MAVSAIDVTVGGSSSNSYITLEVANQYFSDRLNCTEWNNASDDDRIRALLQSVKDLDTLKFIGRKYYLGNYGSATYQTLEFPRQFPSNNFVDDVSEEYTGSFSTEQQFPSSTNDNGEPFIQQQIKDAQCEQALFLLKFLDDVERRANLIAQGVQSFNLGNFSEKYSVNPSGAIICVNSIKLLGDFIDTGMQFIRG